MADSFGRIHVLGPLHHTMGGKYDRLLAGVYGRYLPVRRSFVPDMVSIRSLQKILDPRQCTLSCFSPLSIAPSVFFWRRGLKVESKGTRVLSTGKFSRDNNAMSVKTNFSKRVLTFSSRCFCKLFHRIYDDLKRLDWCPSS
jgi:hypothetical protein